MYIRVIWKFITDCLCMFLLIFTDIFYPFKIYMNQKHIGPKNFFFFKRNQFVLTKTTLGVIFITRNDKPIHMIFILNCH